MAVLPGSLRSTSQMRGVGDAGPGLYLHVPFCRHRCPYCDFNVVAGADQLAIARYVAALRADLERVATGREWPAFGSVYVGGGTPTLLSAADLAGVLRLAREVLPLAEDPEVTVEANPESVDSYDLEALVDAGLTRLSIGAQSFAPHVLAFLGRDHDAGAPLRAVAAARAAGVAHVSVDLIYGTPGESDADWAATLGEAIAAGTDHVSAYALTVERNTPYAADIREGQAAAPDDDVQAARMASAEERLSAAGFRRYEVSNWARPGCESRHNTNYWRAGNWLGVGAGAHGHWAGRRWWRVRPTARYVDLALRGRPTVAGEETLDDATRRVERLMLGLRMVEGVARSQVEPLDEVAATTLVQRGLLHDDGRRLRLTSDGFPLADAVIVRLLP